MDEQQLTSLKGIGEKTAKLFHKLHIDTIHELTTYYPRSYDVYEPCVSVSDTVCGRVNAVRAALVGRISSRKIRNLTILTATVSDETAPYS